MTIKIKMVATPELDYNMKEALSESGTPEFIAELQKRVNNGDVWAWASVEVQAVHVESGVKGEKNYMGGCSYKDSDDFEDNSGYYDDMKSTAIKSLNDELVRVIKALSGDTVLHQQYLGRTAIPVPALDIPAPIACTTVLTNGLEIKIDPDSNDITVKQAGTLRILPSDASPADIVVFTRAVAELAVKAERARITQWINEV